jgi:hypothetical protein
LEKKNNLGFDAGFGYVKVAFRKNGKETVIKYPSVVALAEGFESSTYKFDDRFYYVGEPALKQPKQNIIEVIDYQKLERFAPIFLLEAIKRTGYRADQIDAVITGLSASHTNSNDEFVRTLKKFSCNNDEYNFDVDVLQQGVGAVTAIKRLLKNDIDDYLVIDNGFNTLNTVLVFNKEIQKSKLKGYDNRGVINIAQMVQRHIEKTYNREIAVKEALLILDTNKYMLRGNIYDLSEVITEFKKTYTEDLLNFLEKYYSNEFDKLEKIFFVGGGAHFINQEYSPNIIALKNPEYYNSLGYLFYGDEQDDKIATAVPTPVGTTADFSWKE